MLKQRGAQLQKNRVKEINGGFSVAFFQKNLGALAPYALPVPLTLIAFCMPYLKNAE